MTDTLTACFVGLGSIGCRHLKNLRAAVDRRGLSLRVEALRHRAGPLPGEVSALVDRQVEQVADLGHYDLAFICNPSQLHRETLTRLSGHADRFFVEKPVFVNPVREEDLGDFRDEAKYYVACPLRHTQVFRALREFVSENPVYAARAICSSYLPEWRPNADYRKLYSARPESGGVRVDLIHDFDYLFSLFGIPQDTALFEGKMSGLEIAGPDVVAFSARYPTMLMELHLDYFGRGVQRYVEIFSESDTVRFDFAKASVLWLRSGKRLDFEDRRNDFQLREIEYFLDFALSQAKNVNSIPFANAVLSCISRASNGKDSAYAL